MVPVRRCETCLGRSNVKLEFRPILPRKATQSVTDGRRARLEPFPTPVRANAGVGSEGDRGGRIVAICTPEEVALAPSGYTGE